MPSEGVRLLLAVFGVAAAVGAGLQAGKELWWSL